MIFLATSHLVQPCYHPLYSQVHRGTILHNVWLNPLGEIPSEKSYWLLYPILVKSLVLMFHHLHVSIKQSRMCSATFPSLSPWEKCKKNYVNVPYD